MKEELLHYLWRLRRFDLQALTTTEGQPVDILDTGQYNRHAGPDFLHARVRIGDTLWVGNVEMHLRASEWYQHGHQHDDAYRNVILHVVLDEDRPVFQPEGQRLPCLELRKRIPTRLAATYQQLQHHELWIPCQRHLAAVAHITKASCLDRLAVERLEYKTTELAQRLELLTFDWEEAFYQSLARSMGAPVNAEPLDMLARSLPLKILAKHRSQMLQIEALLFGQAGLLERDFADDYPRLLQREYHLLKHKYALEAIPQGVWKFMRLRPANFPTIRIAQLAALMFGSEHLFSKMLSTQHLREIENAFQVTLSPYWRKRYVFDKNSTLLTKPLGRETIHQIVVNTIAPFLFLYGKHRAEERLKDKALALLQSLPPEKNAIIQQWDQLGLPPASADQSQALLHLKKFYCDQHRCLECAIGEAVMK